MAQGVLDELHGLREWWIHHDPVVLDKARSELKEVAKRGYDVDRFSLADVEA